MPVENYGVWKAKPLRYTFEDRFKDNRSPHLYLSFADNDEGDGRSAINIKSGDKSESRLAYWTVPDFTHPITDRLAQLDYGFKLLAGTPEAGPGGLALDYIRGNLFQITDGRILPHDVDGEDNDILDQLRPIMDQAIAADSTVYIFGSGFSDGKGIHNVHQNQGSPKQYQGANGVYQDGGLIIQFKDHWVAVFIGFASQSIHTGDGPPNAGQPVPKEGYRTWASLLLPETSKKDREMEELTDSPVVIAKAVVNPPGPDNQPGGGDETITLVNRTEAEIDLTGWAIRNYSGQTGQLEPGVRIAAKGSVTVRVPAVPLPNKAGTITLLNAEGLKVHGVAYTSEQGRETGEITFVHE